MLDSADKRVAVRILTRRDENYGQSVSGRSQFLEQFDRVHLGHEQVEHEAAATLGKPRSQHVAWSAEAHWPETGQGDESNQRAQKGLIVVYQYYRGYGLPHSCSGPTNAPAARVKGR